MQNINVSYYHAEFTALDFKFSNPIDNENSSIFEKEENTQNILTNESGAKIDEGKLKLMDLANLIDYLCLVAMKFSVLNKIKNLIGSIFAKLSV